MKKLKLSVLLACVLSLFCGNVANAQMFRVYKNGEVVGAYAKPDSVVYVPATDPMEYVDLGLPSGTKWASCNIGAQVPEDIGDYYQWGALMPIDRTHDVLNDPLSYRFYYTDRAFDYKEYSKYNETDGKRVLDLEDDIAYCLYGKGWSIPSLEQNEELYDNTTITEENINGMPVLRYTATNGNSIIIPKSGFCYNCMGWNQDFIFTHAYFWLNSIVNEYGKEETDVYYIGATSGIARYFHGHTYRSSYSMSVGIYAYRAYGCPVRPVYVPQK